MNDASALKKQILSLVEEYYTTVHDAPKDFVPGSSPIPYAGRVFDAREMTNLVDASLDFWLTSGSYTERFEDHLARYLGVDHTLFVNSGSSANLLAFMALTAPELGQRQIQRGDEVITVAACFPTTVAPILQYGAVPVFVDIDSATLNIDVAQLESALSKKSKCVFLAHTLGNPFALSTVIDFCKRHNLWLIEDNCDALGSEYQGRKTGTFGDIGTSSFYPPHHITTGEGGAVYTANATLARILRSLRDWGRDCWCPSGTDDTCKRRFSQQFGTLPPGYDHKYVYSRFGYNLKATDLQAAIGVAQLEKIDTFVSKRREHFAYLKDALQPVADKLTFLTPEADADPSWFGFTILLDKTLPVTRNDLAQQLEAHKIQTRNLFSGNVTRHPCFESLQPDKDYRIATPLPQTDRIMNHLLWVGVYPGMDCVHLEYIAQTILSCLK